ncbi:protein-disulfide reductase DsbD family protein [Mesonia maritima]|uniref:Thiol:disulfide interchange protein DsbD n=1 Tax=Mesonia maritima TaxID=1793873 RepID=A0ABU1K671_9FLAO|nr:cytochrome c biogenesis protein CcdA [Mesonia maritima]MDR6301109.1 thiol:disulfide interchange protein DsbD [Mesonia maritima]
MKYYLSILLVFLTFITANAQFDTQKHQGEIVDPVEWTGKIEKKSENNYQFILEADIEEEWHIYSQNTPEGGPLPLWFNYLDSGNGYQLKGKTKESESKRQYSELFEVDEVYFEKEATFKQDIVITDENLSVIKMELKYQVCKEVCIGEEYYVIFDIKKDLVKIIQNYDDFSTYGTSPKKEEKQPEIKEENTKKIAEDVGENEEEKGLITIFFLAFIAGFAALLTPCVFPMIPMTVGFFTKQSKDRSKGIKNALLYGFFIVIIYVLLGTIVTAIFGADALNALSTNVTFNIVFFILLVIFAASFLGAFEIMLPNSWANKVDRQADRGGVIGIFFMALALAIVSFSCTGPIVGTLLVEAASKGGLAPIIGMLGFSLAIAIPFALFAMFPGWMNTLPKSGGWLNTVKVVLGFLELALAFKFLSNADLVLQAHILEREIFLAIWIAIFGALAFYLFGKIKLPHDSPINHISVGRLGLGLLILSFTIYLIPGLWGAPLKMISGFTPPLNYSEAPYGVGNRKVGVASTAAKSDFPDHAKLGPHDILTFTDYEKGVEYAKEKDLPILLDFTGYACINCRKMEERVWSEPQILGKLKKELVLISLYVDAKEKLPEDERYTSKTTGKRIRTIGNKWSDFQIKNYGANAQPYYIILNHDEEMLNSPIGYTPDIEEYEAWLNEGIDNFK